MFDVTIRALARACDADVGACTKARLDTLDSYNIHVYDIPTMVDSFSTYYKYKSIV